VTPAELAANLNLRRPDRFADLRSPAEPSADGRLLAALVHATRATYVLELGAGGGYGSLSIAAAFGLTGRLDAVEQSLDGVARIEAAARDHGLSDRLKVIAAPPAAVLPGLNGPYDLVVVEPCTGGLLPVYADLIRVLRTGGSLILPAIADLDATRPLLERLAGDERVAAYFPETLAPVLVTRLR
jgi:predicted O-methyltransferase YrrM